MKKTAILLVLALLFSCCSREDRVLRTASNHLKYQMKDPSSFEVIKSQVVLDTIPFFLNNDLLLAANGVNYCFDQYTAYNGIPTYGNAYLDAQKKAREKVYNDALAKMHQKYLAAKNNPNKLVANIVLIQCSSKNSRGGTVGGRYVVIVDKDNPDDVLGTFAIDSEFIKEIVAIYLNEEAEKYKLNQDELGLDPGKLTPVEAMIFGY